MADINEAAMGLAKWAATVAAAAAAAWLALVHRVSTLEKYKADAQTVALMANDIHYMKRSLERIERKLEKKEGA